MLKPGEADGSGLTGRERAGLALAAIAVVAIAFLSEPSMFTGVDFARVHEPYKHYFAQALRSGRLPLWNPHVNLGRPFLADVDSALFYPPHLLYAFLDVHAAWFVLAPAHVWLALTGATRLFRAVGVQRWLALAAALVLVVSGPVVEIFQNGLIHYAIGFAYLPWVLLFALRLQDAPSWLTATKLAGLVALQFLGGHAQLSWITAVGAGLLMVGRRLERPLVTAARAALLDLLRLGGAALWGLGLAAVQLLPSLELATQGNRHRSFTFADSFSMPWWGWYGLVAPVGPRFPLAFSAIDVYCGLLVLIAGLCGLTAVRDRNARGLLLVAAGAAIIAAGRATPLFAPLYHLLPGFSSFRLHARTLILATVALVAGAGLFLSRPAGDRRVLFLVGAVGSVVAGVALLFELRSLPLPTSALPLPRGTPLVTAALVVAAAVLLATWMGRRPHSPRARVVLLAAMALVVAADLARSTLGVKTVRQERFDDRPERAVVALLAQMKLGAPHSPPPRLSVPMPYVRENAGMIYGFSTFAGYVTLSLDRVFVYLYTAAGLEVPLLNTSFPAANIYDAGPFPYRSMNLTLGFDPRTRKVVYNPAPDPRAYLTFSAEVVPSWRDAIRRMRRGHDFHRVALIEKPRPPGLFGAAAEVRHQVTIRHFEPERLVLTVDSPAAALLVIAEAWYPGWTATVNGHAVPCEPANGWMRSVPVPIGASEVVLTYRSRYLAAGAALSALAALAAALVLLGARRAAAVGDRMS